MSFKKLLLPLVAILALGACASPPMATSHQHVTSDGQHWAVQMSMSTGVVGTPVQTLMLVYNRYSHEPRAIVQGQSLRLDDRLLDAVLSLGPTIVSGQYLLEAERIGCPAGTVCGTLVQVSNSAGANADSTATAQHN